MSDFVIVDITYPNPNVFYELGIRHAIKKGTILLKDEKVETKLPFDINTQRCIFYDNTTPGLKRLTADLKARIIHYENNQDDSYTDNHVLDYSRLIKFKYPNFSDEDNTHLQQVGVINIFEALLESETIMQELLNAIGTTDPKATLAIQAISRAYRTDRENGQRILIGFIQMGLLDPRRILNHFVQS